MSRRSAAGSALQEDVEPFFSALYRIFGRLIVKPATISIDTPVADYMAFAPRTRERTTDKLGQRWRLFITYCCLR